MVALRKPAATLLVLGLLIAALLLTVQFLGRAPDEGPATPQPYLFTKMTDPDPPVGADLARPQAPVEQPPPASQSLPESVLDPRPPARIVPDVVSEPAPDVEGRHSPTAAVHEVDTGHGGGGGIPFDRVPYRGRGGSLGAPLGSHEVQVPAGWAWIGTAQDWLEGFEQRRDGPLPEALFMEAPRHRVEMYAYTIDRRETTNQEWWEYLVALHRARELTRNGDRLRSMVLRFVGPSAHWTEDDLLRMEWQLMEGNRSILFPALPSVVVRDTDGRIGALQTFEALRERELPSGLRLAFYRRPPPLSWPSTRFEEVLSDHPVRGISGLDAVDYAQWAGAHVPTELEWEYAVLGEGGPMWPWGNDLVGFETYVVGGTVGEPGQLPRTKPAHLQTGGESWVGLMHGVGNVSEWTSSYLDPYPESVSSHPQAGRVLVVRGGSVAEQDAYLMRPAQRGWVKAAPGAPDATPQPWRALPYTGVRLARYESPLASCVVNMQTQARAEGLLDPSLLRALPWAGERGVLALDLDPRREDPLDVGPGVKALLVQPLSAPAVFHVRAGIYTPLQFSGTPTLDSLIGASTGSLPLLLGLWHSDVHVLDCWIPREGAVGPPLEKLVRHDAAPGTWFLGLWHGFPVLVRPDLGEVVILENHPATKGELNVHERKLPRDGRPRAMASLRIVGDKTAKLEIEVPAGVGSSDRAYVVRLRLSLQVPATVLKSVTQWDDEEAEDR